ncbi:ABC transporter, partial [Haemophilus influenzae]
AVLWNWVALVVVGWALAHQQTIVRYFGGLKPTLR